MVMEVKEYDRVSGDTHHARVKEKQLYDGNNTIIFRIYKQELQLCDECLNKYGILRMSS
jgi:hypothetical protein